MNAGLCQTIVGLWNVNPVSDWWESLRGAFKGSPDCSAPPGSVKLPPPRTGGGHSDRGPSVACLSSSPEPSRSCSCWDSPGELLSQTTVGLSHTVTQYSQGKAFEKEWGWGGGVISCTNCTTLLRSWGTWVPAVPEQGPPLSPSPSWGLCRRPGWQTELLSGASRVSITWNVKQNIRGRLTCLCERRRVWKSPWKTRRCVTSENKLGFYPRELVSRAGLLVATLSSRKFDSVLHNKTKESEAFFLVAEKVYATQLCPGIQTSNLQITNPIP